MSKFEPVDYSEDIQFEAPDKEIVANFQRDSVLSSSIREAEHD